MQYVVYNCMLRQFPRELYAKHAAHGNRFVTTINVLVSAVTKLSRVSVIPAGLELYRGLGGLMDLPPHFHSVDERGCSGFMEYGFMSTSSERSVAVQYSGVSKGRPRAMVMALRADSVDRGACIAEFSQ